MYKLILDFYPENKVKIFLSTLGEKDEGTEFPADSLEAVEYVKNMHSYYEDLDVEMNPYTGGLFI